MYIVSNIIIAVLLAGGVWTGLFIARHRLWSNTAGSLWQRRKIAISVLGLFLMVAVLDSISWIDGAGAAGSDGITAFTPRTILDRLFDPTTFQERSYSAPFASGEFYGGMALEFPGSHVMGTDVLGRDILYLTMKGIRVALLIGGFTCLIVIPLALFFGVAAGYFGGRTDDGVFFVMSTLASIPNLLLLIALIMVMGRGTFQVCVALGITSWVGFCRITRAETLKLRESNYVQAAKALGVSDTRIIFSHILPNLAHLIIIAFALLFTALVLFETILSYLGVGIVGSWGQMIDQARDELSRDPVIWWNLTSASIALFTLVLTVNLIGDALRDILDPRTLREVE